MTWYDVRMKIGLILFSALLAAAPCRAGDIVFGVSTGSAMPMTEFSNGTLTGGLLKEFGDALARELHYTPYYVSLPRKRVEAALGGGQVDLLCDLRPEWLDEPGWLWSDAIFTNQQIVVSRADMAPLKRLADLRERRIGTILGYRYPELDAALGQYFVRDEAASDDLNLSKLLRHRFDYLLTNSLYFEYQLKDHAEYRQQHLRVFPVMSFDTYCALPLRGKLDRERLNKAIAALKKRGDIQRMMEHFRLPAGP